MKIKHSLNYIILIGFFLFISVLGFVKPVLAQQGYNLWALPIGVNENPLHMGTDTNANLFSHFIDPNLKTKFLNGISQKDAPNKIVYLPIPTVIRQEQTSSNGNLGYIDDDYPDAIYTGGISSESKFLNTNYTKQCGKDAPVINGTKITQASVIFYIPISYLVNLNINLNTDHSTLDTPGGNPNKTSFISPDLKDKNQNIILEYCYNSIVVIDNKIATIVDNNNETHTFSRRVVGSGTLSLFQAFPPSLQTNQYQFISYPIYVLPVGTPIKPITAWEDSSNKDKSINQGNRYGEFQIIDYNNPLNCNLTSPIVSTDLFGHKILGVQTALGCLPGSFEGIFTVILRISVGVSAALMLILIIVNGFTLMQGNNNPEVLKKVVTNISRGVTALFIILFSVIFLNFIGIKILDLNSLGSIGLQQVTGQ